VIAKHGKLGREERDSVPLYDASRGIYRPLGYLLVPIAAIV